MPPPHLLSRDSTSGVSSCLHVEIASGSALVYNLGADQTPWKSTGCVAITTRTMYRGHGSEKFQAVSTRMFHLSLENRKATNEFHSIYDHSTVRGSYSQYLKRVSCAA